MEAQGVEVEDLTPAALLAELRSERRAEEAAAARQLLLAAAWADLHPPESIHHAASFSVPAAGREHVEAIAGPGCPAVAEFCVAELGGPRCLHGCCTGTDAPGTAGIGSSSSRRP